MTGPRTIAEARIHDVLNGPNRMDDEVTVTVEDQLAVLAELRRARLELDRLTVKARAVVDADRFGGFVSGAVSELARVLPAEEEAA